jgi:hypothetical protein
VAVDGSPLPARVRAGGGGGGSGGGASSQPQLIESSRATASGMRDTAMQVLDTGGSHAALITIPCPFNCASTQACAFTGSSHTPVAVESAASM